MSEVQCRTYALNISRLWGYAEKTSVLNNRLRFKYRHFLNASVRYIKATRNNIQSQQSSRCIPAILKVRF